MNSRSFFQAVVVLFTIWGFTHAALAYGEDAAKGTLDGIVEKYIRTNAAKARLLGSKSSRIRKDAAVSIMKSLFASYNKDELIRRMTLEKVTVKNHAVAYYINSLFFDNFSIDNTLALK